MGKPFVADETGEPARPARLLAIESSCDETAAAVIDQDRRVLSSVVGSQFELHERFGGVVPEIASRAHVRRILPIVDEALKQADTHLSDLSAVAVATQPGLVGSLLVGLTAAKTLAAVLDVPLIGVNHIEAHIYACRMAGGSNVFPAIGFVVSGGHSNLYDCTDPVTFQLLGSTLDDAAGEAFDKVAKMLGLPYPGGPSIERAAQAGDPAAFEFPRPLFGVNRLDFSFSGLKTAVLYEVKGKPGSSEPPVELTPNRVADVAASFQEAVVDVLVEKCRLALNRHQRKTLCVGGGVAANARLRQKLEQMTSDMDIRLIVAPLEHCTDNAAMAAIAWERLERGQADSLETDVVPGLVRRAASDRR